MGTSLFDYKEAQAPINVLLNSAGGLAPSELAEEKSSHLTHYENAQALDLFNVGLSNFVKPRGDTAQT